MERGAIMISLLDFLNFYVLVGCVAVLLWIYSQSTYNYWRKLNVKYLKPVPLFGNITKVVFFLETFYEAYDKLYVALGNEPYGGFYQMRDPQLMVKDPQLVSAILTIDCKNFFDRGLSFRVNKNRNLNPLRMHLFFSEGERWKVLRQKISPIFTAGKLKQAQDQIFHFVALMKKFIDKQMDGQNSLDLSLKDLFGRLAVDVMGSYAFGIECNALKSNEKFMEMCKKFFEITTRDSIRIMLSSYPKLLNLLKFPDVRKDVSDFFLNLILDTMENRRKHGVKRNDTMQLLMELQNSYVDPRFAVGEQDKKILKNETLRKYPPFTILSRMCTEDYVIPGTKTRVTAGTEVIIPVWSIHHDRKHYPNPEVFDPERFLGDSKQSIPNGAYLPFGEGHRYCLGQRFAEMEIKATLAEIVLKFNLKPCSKTEIPLKFKLGSYLLQNQCETWVNIEKRKD